jgi:hypothetical protein
MLDSRLTRCVRLRPLDLSKKNVSGSREKVDADIKQTARNKMPQNAELKT